MAALEEKSQTTINKDKDEDNMDYIPHNISTVPKIADNMSLNSIPMNEYDRWMIQIIMIIRLLIRNYFGLSFANRWGFWLDTEMSKSISKYGWWIDYPTGHQNLKGHKGSVNSAVISKHRRFLFTGSDDSSIIKWDLTDNKLVHQWEAQGKGVTQLVYVKGMIISGGSDGLIQIWNAFSYELIRSLKGHTERVNTIDVNPSSSIIVSGSKDDSIRVWSLKSGLCLNVINPQHYSVISVQLVGDGTIMCVFDDDTARILDVSTGIECKKLIQAEGGQMLDAISLNCDASLAAVPFEDEGLVIYKWPSLKEVYRDEGVHAKVVKFHPCIPDILAVNYYDYWERPEEEKERIKRPDSYDIRIYSLSQRKCIKELNAKTGRVHDFLFTSHGDRLITVARNQSVIVWDISDIY